MMALRLWVLLMFLEQYLTNTEQKVRFLRFLSSTGSGLVWIKQGVYGGTGQPNYKFYRRSIMSRYVIKRDILPFSPQAMKK
jgi:hypothetical protein